MAKGKEVAREISYAHSAASRGGAALIRLMENVTGRLGLIRQALGYEQEVASGRDFWEVMVERYRLSLDVMGGSLDNIPKDGPLILIANHPYGILDGLMMGHILSKTRGDFRILAHQVFRKAEDLNRVILPIAFDETKEAVKLNLETRKNALNYLNEGGAIGVFPGGRCPPRLNHSRGRWTRDGAVLPRKWWRNPMRLWSRSTLTVTTAVCSSWPAICTTPCAWGS